MSPHWMLLACILDRQTCDKGVDEKKSARDLHQNNATCTKAHRLTMLLLEESVLKKLAV